MSEKNEDGTLKDRVEIVKERLGLKPNVNIHITPKGINYTQLRAMILLRSKKYSELTTDQLKTLRNIILFSLIDESQFHANQWEERLRQIEIIADLKGISLDDEVSKDNNSNSN